jgi:hypothetical protein
MTLGAAFTHVQAKFLHSGHPIPGAPRRFATATLHLGRERGPFGGARLLWMGIRPLAHGAQTDGYVQVDADAGWRFSRVDVVLAVDNVFNADIMEGAYHFASWFDQTRARSEIPEIHFTAAPPVTARLVVTLRL